MIEPKIVTSGQFVLDKDGEGNPVVKFKQKTTTLKYDMMFRTWKTASETTKLIDVETHSPKFSKKLSFHMIWKRNLQPKGTVPYGLGIQKYEYLTRKVTIAVKPDFWSVYLYCETFGVPKRKMGTITMRDFFNIFGHGIGQISYSKTPAGHPLRVREGKWKVITEAEANKIYSSGCALLVGRVQEDNGITVYSFGGEIKA